MEKLRKNSALRFKLIPEKDEDANENPDVKFILEASAEVFLALIAEGDIARRSKIRVTQEQNVGSCESD